MAPVRVGVELIAAATTRLHLGSFFESWLAVPGGTLRRSLGRDEYHLDITLSAGRRVAATGRTYICQIDAEAAGIGTNQARGAVLAPCDREVTSALFLGMRTNLFLDLPALMAGVRLRILQEGLPAVLVALDDPRVGPEQVAPGRYLVDLTGVLD